MIILTGGAGFIGSAFLWKLNQEGIKDILVVDELDRSEKWRNLVGKNFQDYIEKDVFLDLLQTDKIAPPEKIVHMGALSSTTSNDSRYFIENNYEYSKQIASWAIKHKARFIYASSAATYGDGSKTYRDNESLLKTLQPMNMYAFSKHLFDLWLQKNDLLKKVVGIKFFNVFGPNEYHKGEMMSVICKAFPQLYKEGKIKLFRSHKKEYPDGGQKRDFVYIKDAVDVMYYLSFCDGITGIYNLGTGKARSWNDVAESMFKALGRKPEIEYVDMPVSLRDKYQYFTEADMTKLRESGYVEEFMSLEDSVEDYVNNYLVKGKTL